jgi:uncharacterized membrane protein
VFCVCVAVVIAYILIVGFSLVTMDKNDAEDVPEALLKVAEGSARFTTSLYKVSGSCYLTLMWRACCLRSKEYDIYHGG